MAAAIITPVPATDPGLYNIPGNRRFKLFDFTFSTSYPAGGEPMTPSLFGLGAVDAVIPLGSVRAAAAVIAAYDGTNNTLTLNTATTGAVAGTGTDQSSNKVRVLVIGF